MTQRVKVIAARSSYYGERGRVVKTDLRGHFPILVRLDSGDCLNFAVCELEFITSVEPIDPHGILTNALYDAENTARLAEHPDDVPAYRSKAAAVWHWLPDHVRAALKELRG